MRFFVEERMLRFVFWKKKFDRKGKRDNLALMGKEGRLFSCLGNFQRV